MLYSWIIDAIMGTAYTILQYIYGVVNKFKKKVKKKANVTPTTIPIWLSGANVDTSYVGVNYLIYIGTTAVIIPIVIPCKHLAISNTHKFCTCNKTQTTIIANAKSIKHCFLVLYLIRYELQNAPNPPVKDKQPVRMPCMMLRCYC